MSFDEFCIEEQVKKSRNFEHKIDISKLTFLPPVDLHWFFEISTRTEKKNQLELKKKIQLVYTDFFPVLT